MIFPLIHRINMLLNGVDSTNQWAIRTSIRYKYVVANATFSYIF